jgi:hypothetical protein
MGSIIEVPGKFGAHYIRQDQAVLAQEAVMDC